MSVEIDKEQLADAYQYTGDVDEETWLLALMGWDWGRFRGVQLCTKESYADKSVYTFYSPCEGVTTGGAYLFARYQRAKWIDASEPNTKYWVELAPAKSTSDVGLWKTVDGADTELARESVDLTDWDRQHMILSCEGTTLHVYRGSGSDIGLYPDSTPAGGALKISDTDSAIDEGALGVANFLSRYSPTTYQGQADYLQAGWTHPASRIMPPHSETPMEPIAYFEAPIVGSGVIPDKPVSLEEEQAGEVTVDPYRVELPEEVIEQPLKVPVAYKNRADVLRKHGLDEEVIKAIIPQAFKTERVNRLAMSYSALIPTDSHGKPTGNTGIVRVFQSTRPEVHSIEKRVEAFKKMQGVTRIKQDQAITKALHVDEKLHIHDLVACRKHPLGGKCFREYKEWRVGSVSEKPEFADTEGRKRYVKAGKGW